MKVTVCPSGLKAVTKEHGLTEYWANRITYCTADPEYPKVFCWIYRCVIALFFSVIILHQMKVPIRAHFDDSFYLFKSCLESWNYNWWK